MKKIILLIFFLTFASNLTFAQLTSLNYPESIAYDKVTDTYFISNVGNPNAPDGKVVKLDRNQKLSGFYDQNLTDPKGLTVLDGKLFIADITKVVVVDIETGLAEKTINISTSIMLNDLTNDGTKYVYATDMGGNKIFRIDSKTYQFSPLLVKGSISSPNGILFDFKQDRLIVVTFKENATIHEVLLSDLSANLLATTSIKYMDGIEMDRAGKFYVSAWEEQNIGTGKIYQFNETFAEAPKTVASSLNGPADICFNKTIDTLLVPNMISSTVSYFGFPFKPAVAILVSPEDKSKDLDSAVTFTWERADGATKYLIQVSTNKNFDPIVYEKVINSGSITSQNTFLNTNTIYYWRVRSDNHTENGDWSQVWSFTTKDINNYKPNLIAPTNASENIELKPEFKWSEVPVDKYELIISKLGDFSSDTVLNIFDIANTSYTPGTEFENSTLYYWRIRGYVGDQAKDWSDIWSFTTAGKLPAKPLPMKPAEDATDINIDAEFEWAEQEDATDYKLLVAKSEDMANAQTYDISGINKYTVIGLDPVTDYYWQVIALNSYGESEPSDVWHFKTWDPASVNEELFDSYLTMAPNPADKELTLDINNNRIISEMKITSSAGIILLQELFVRSNMKIDISRFASGMYLISINIDGNWISKSFRIVR